MDAGYDMNKGTPLAESDAPLAGLAAGIKQYHPPPNISLLDSDLSPFRLTDSLADGAGTSTWGSHRTSSCSVSSASSPPLVGSRVFDGSNRCRLCTGLATFVTDYQCNSTAHDHSSTGTACVKTTPWKSSIARRPYAGDLGSGPFAGLSAMSLLRKSGGAAAVRWDEAAAAPLFDYCQQGQSYSSWEPHFTRNGAQMGCANGGTRHQVWFQDNRSIAARRTSRTS